MKHFISVADVSLILLHHRISPLKFFLALSNIEQLLLYDCHHLRIEHSSYSPVKANVGTGQSKIHGAVCGMRDDHR